MFFAIAENFRYHPSLIYAAEQIQTLGRVLGFSIRVQTFVQPEGKYISAFPRP